MFFLNPKHPKIVFFLSFITTSCLGSNLAMDWKKMNIFGELGDRWYKGVILWWGLFAACIISLVITFSQIVFGN
ncbi:MAG: hypothetical protein LLF92_08460 [Planctomycetaceae bacterium]|nr:hypothetical protein [Planctomycetaceae bacterium]